MVRPGDLVVTRDHGLRPVRLVLERRITRARILRDPDLAPIRLAPRAIGPMMPQRELLLAPDHKLLVPGFRVAGHEQNSCCLIEARDLAGCCDAAHIDSSGKQTGFYTLVFDTHEVFTANGLPVESFLPCGSALERMTSRLRNDLLELFPQLEKQPLAYPAARYRIVSAADYQPSMA